MKNQLDDMKDKMKFYQEENMKIMEQKKSLEEKQNYNKFASQSFKSLVKEKENEVLTLREEMKFYETYKQEKPKMEKKLADLLKINSSLKDDNERKNLRIKDLEKLILNNKLISEQDIENISFTLNKKIKLLEQEILQFKKNDLHSKDKLFKSSAFLTETKIDQKDQNKESEDLKNKIKSLEGNYVCLI